MEFAALATPQNQATLILDTYRSLRTEIESINASGERWLHAWPVGFGLFWYWLLKPGEAPIQVLAENDVVRCSIVWLPTVVTACLGALAFRDMWVIDRIARHLSKVEQALGIAASLCWETQSCQHRRPSKTTESSQEITGEPWFVFRSGRMLAWFAALMLSGLVAVELGDKVFGMKKGDSETKDSSSNKMSAASSKTDNAPSNASNPGGGTSTPNPAQKQ